MACRYQLIFSFFFVWLEYCAKCTASSCAAGQYVVSGECVNCDLGDYQGIMPQCETGSCCTNCGTGTYQHSSPDGVINMGCARCPTRHFNNLLMANIGPGSCQPCLQKHSWMYMSRDTGNSSLYFSCRICRDHSAQNESVHDATPPWPADIYAADGGAHADNAKSCLCNAGFFHQEAPNGYDHTCIPCARGTYKGLLSNSETCQQCPSLSDSPPQSTAVSACTCNAGWGGAAGGPCSPALTGCPVNHFLHGNNTCRPCLAGMYKLGTGTGGCTTLGPGATACNECPVGKYADVVGMNTCALCGTGTFSNTTGSSSSDTCVECEAGKFSNIEASANQTTCTSCGPGKYSRKGQRVCTFCKEGKYAAASGAVQCESCPPNSHSTTSALLVSQAVCVCNAGYTGNATISSYLPSAPSCTACAIGKYKAGFINSNACQECEFAQHKISEAPGAIQCDACPRAKLAHNASTCVFCAVGMFWQDNYTCAPCQLFGPGYKQQLVQEREHLFPQDQQHSAVVAEFQLPTAPRYDNTLCAGCECTLFLDSLPTETLDTCHQDTTLSRQYFNAKNRRCEVCPDYKRIVRDVRKRSCDPYNASQALLESRQWNDTSQLYQCIAGHYSTNAMQTWSSPASCQACEHGKYKPQQSPHKCTDCPGGTYTRSTAAVSAEECVYCSTDHRLSHQDFNGYVAFVSPARVYYRSLLMGVLARLSKCTCKTVKMYLQGCQNVLARLSKCTCKTVKMYLQSCQNVLARLSKCTCKAVRMNLQGIQNELARLSK